MNIVARIIQFLFSYFIFNPISAVKAIIGGVWVAVRITARNLPLRIYYGITGQVGWND